MSRADPRAQAGVTLIELLVCLVLLGLLTGLFQDGFALGHRVWERASTRITTRLEAVEGAQAFLRERLQTLYPAWQSLGEPTTSFQGSPDVIAFEAAPPDVFGRGTWRRFRIAVSATGGLEVAWKPDTDRNLIPVWERATLLPAVAGLELAYFGPVDGAPPRWRPYWTAQPTPPRLVRLRVLFPPGDPRIWPDLVVAPRATVDATCAYDAVQRRCRGRT